LTPSCFTVTICDDLGKLFTHARAHARTHTDTPSRASVTRVLMLYGWQSNYRHGVK